MRFQPYMSPSEYDKAIASHVEASYSSKVHARLRASLAGVALRGRKQAHRNDFIKVSCGVGIASVSNPYTIMYRESQDGKFRVGDAVRLLGDL